MDLIWKPSYTTGNKAVDFQHQCFVDLINRISKSLLETEDEKYREKLLIELIKYAEFHFTSEENLAFLDNKIEGLHVHHKRHMELLEELCCHTKDLMKDHYSAEEFIRFLINWFVGHTVYEDCAFFLGE